MRRIITVAILLIASITFANAQRVPLKFNENGKFKVIQITDTHLIYGNPESDVVPALLNEILEAEKPDLLVFTGDMIWKNKDTKQALDILFAPAIAHKTPWAYVFGNHDDESDMNRKDIMDYVTQMPYCLATHGNASLSGVGNYTLEIESKDGKGKIGTVLYCLDSHAYSQIKGIGNYAWFDFNQIDWYRQQSAAYTNMNGGTPMNSLAFFHIPLAEYVDMADNKEDLIGNKTERECNGYLNTGMFGAMRTAGDVMGTFVGHDHDNDYIGNWHDIYLAYGRYSGGKTVYNNLGKNGCRVIELTEGVREFNTYIRLLGGEKLQNVHYPTTLKKEKEEKK